MFSTDVLHKNLVSAVIETPHPAVRFRRGLGGAVNAPEESSTQRNNRCPPKAQALNMRALAG